jgi:hypothetical protein
MGFAIFKLPAAYDKFQPLPVGYDSVLFTAGEAPAHGARHLEYGGTEAVSKTSCEGFPLAFEIVSLLIFAAVLGAVLLARRHLSGPGTEVPREETPREGKAGHHA